jgi:hypothetical protein
MKTNILIIVLFLFAGCENELIVPEPANDPESIFEYFWKSYNTDYVLFEERDLNWSVQYDIYRPMVNSGTNDDELFSIFKQMLEPLNDGHVKLIKPNEKVYTPNIYYEYRLEDDLFDLDLVRESYLSGDFKVNGYEYNTYGWIGDIGYIHTVWTSDNWEDMDAIIEYFETANGLIMDLRHNGGGDFTEALSRFGRFTDQERLAFRSRTKNGEGPQDFTDWYDWKLYPEGAYIDKPIVMLTDRYTISAGERLVMAFQALPNVTTVGDTTNGALSSMILRELPNGWNYSVCPQEVESFDGNFYEGIGLLPDFLVENTSEEIQNGQDKTLEFALSLF